MSTNTSGTTTTGSTVSSLISSSSSKTTGTQLKSSDVVSKDEFLQMLVTQLKTQDPMDPMDSDQFAVNLAQFSQLEQLISINDTLESGLGSDSSSLATYLGQEVSWSGDAVQVNNNDGGRIRFNLGADSADLHVELLNSGGSVVETVDLGAVASGRHSVALENLSTSSGEYTVRVTSTGYGGEETEVKYNLAGVVTGFVPGADPTLLVGDTEVKASDILEVAAV